MTGVGLFGEHGRVIAAGLVLGMLLHVPTVPAGAHRQGQGDVVGERMESVGVVPGVVVVRFREGAGPLAAGTRAKISSRLEGFSVGAITKVFPGVRALSRADRDAGRIDLSAIHFLAIRHADDPVAAARVLSLIPDIVWAEPLYLHRLLDVPNDPGLSAQVSPFALLRLQDGWTIAKGNRSVAIAVIDGGTKWDHEDLAANIWVNSPEDLNKNGRFEQGPPPGGDENGIDDDGNGKVDDVIGWNFTNNSNNPGGLPNGPGSFAHGTAVASHYGAVTNNGLGMAGSSWNCSIMPVTVASLNGDNLIAYGYQGIEYASRNGAKVINCSWGRQGGYSQFEQEVITAATQAGALIVAAAGNDGSDSDGILHFPSGYDNVLAVGATNSVNDVIAGFSNYGVGVDVFAPGVSIYSALTGTVKYGNGGSGTSYSSPLVAGIAGILAARNPGWTPAQIAMQIRMTADPIDGVNNVSLTGRLGRGRANLFRALTETPAGLSVIGSDIRTLSGKEIFLPGDTIALTLTFQNILFSTANDIQWTATPRDPALRMVQNTASVSAVAPGAVVQLPPFLFLADAVLNPREVLIDVRWTGGGELADAAAFRVIVFPDIPLWLAQDSPTSTPLYSVRAVDRNVAWAAGGAGGTSVVIRTADKGTNWHDATGNLSGTNLYCVFALDSLTAWVGTGDGRIFRTTNGGSSWAQQFYFGTQSPFINGIWFFDRNNGVAQGDPPPGTGSWVVIRTTNGGTTWNSVPSPPVGVVGEAGWNNSFWWSDPQHGWFGTNQNKVWRTTNGGDSWVASPSGATNSYAVAFRDDRVGIAVHDAGVVQRSTDGGVSWSPVSSGTAQTLVSASFAPGTPAAWVADGSSPYRSRDGGSGWQRQTPYPFRGSLQHLSMADSSTGWAVVSSGEVLRYSGDVLTGAMSPAEPGIPGSYALEQNYPNPFNSSTTIRFSLPAESQVRLVVIDLLGRVAGVLAEGIRPAGTTEVVLEARDWSTGIYFYRLEALPVGALTGYTEVRRLVLLR